MLRLIYHLFSHLLTDNNMQINAAAHLHKLEA